MCVVLYMVLFFVMFDLYRSCPEGFQSLHFNCRSSASASAWVALLKPSRMLLLFHLSHESVMLRDVMVIRAIDLTRAIPNLCWHFVIAFVLHPVFRAEIVSPKYIQGKNNVFLSCHRPPKVSKQFNILCASSHSLYSLRETALFFFFPTVYFAIGLCHNTLLCCLITLMVDLNSWL